MDLGIFSISLSVKDIAKSKTFYEKLGFKQLEGLGSIEDKWLIMQNGDKNIGLFQDMFDTNTLTFNPSNARAIFTALKADEVEIHQQSKSIEEEKGPCHFMLFDPDGNPILIDQHSE